MKRLILAIVSLATSLSALAQSPTTTYPYLYPRFTDGQVVLDTGKKEPKKMNIHLRRDALHYLDDGIIKEAFLKDVAAVEIGTDVFLPVNGRMMKVVAKNDKGCIVEEILGDFESSQEAKGAYGVSSTTSATMKLSSIQTDSQINQNYMNILNEKKNGVELRTEHTYYAVCGLKRVKATKKEITRYVPEEKQAEWKAFQKKHKIKWKNPNSLLTVLDFLSELQ